MNKALLSGCAAAALILAACGGGDEAADTTVAATTTSTTTTSTTVPKTTTTRPSTTTSTIVAAVPRQPLTGAPLESADDIVDRPALAVKIDNHPAARDNHSGLAVADIVFEEIVEGSLTRFAAVFHSQGSDPVGPIRSGRSQDVDILSSLNMPLYAWSGGNGGVTRLIAASLLTDLNWQKHVSAYYRGPGSNPHDLYSSTDTLWGLTPPDHPGAPLQQFVYLDDDDSFDGDDIVGVDIAMRGVDVSWEWDEELGAFARWQEGEPHLDAVHGPITAKNVIVPIVEYQPSEIDSNSPEAQTLGEGRVFIFSDGQVKEGRWARAASVYPFEFTDLDGEPIAINPGNTWVELAEAIPTDDPAMPGADMVIRPAE